MRGVSPDPFERVAAAVADVPFMTRDQGRRVYDHLVGTGARDVLDVGTCYGTSAAYMAAAVEANGGGRVITVDSAQFDAEAPTKNWVEQSLTKAGVRDLVELVRIDHSSYAYWLMEQVAMRSDERGDCEPAFDFVYLDGAKSLTIDGVSAFFIERLLRPGGWLLMDDLDWTFDANPKAIQAEGPYSLSQAERSTPQLLGVFDNIVRAIPGFTELRVEDGQWGWAHKAPDAPRRYDAEATAHSRSPLVRLRRRARRPGPG